MAHCAKVRVVTGGAYSALIAISLLPHGKAEYVDTIVAEAASWFRLSLSTLAYWTGAVGRDVGDRAASRRAGRMAEWLTFVAAVYGAA